MKSRSLMSFAGATLVAGVVAAGLPAAAAAAPVSIELKSGACEGTDEFICGPTNAEELIHLEGTPWIFASQLGAPFLREGAIAIVHSKDRRWGSLPLNGSGENFDRSTYAGCPGPLKAEEFVGHGMTFRHLEGGKATLYAVNHGKRESVEVFEVTANGDELPGFHWVGCILSPNNDSLNTLAVLPDGGLAGTIFYELENGANWVVDMVMKKTTGQVFEWHAGKGWTVVPRSFMSGPNGIALAEDGHLIVAEWGAKQLRKLSRDGSGEQIIVEIDGRPDNIHPAPDGKFYVVAQTLDDQKLAEFGGCMASENRVCGGTFNVYSIDPADLSLETVIEADIDPTVFGFGTSALDLGDEIWVGSTRGNKIAVFKK